MSDYRVQSIPLDETAAETLLEGIMEGSTIDLNELELKGTNIRESIFEIVEVPDDE